jgi:DNA-binding MarR family transcriptional regulator
MKSLARRQEPAALPPASPLEDAGLDYRALAELRHQIRRFLSFSENEARAAGVEPQQHQLLLAVKGLPAGVRPTIGVLADRLLLKHHTVVGLVDRLVAAELAARFPSETDKREILVRLTARGERILRKLSLTHQAELKTAAPSLARALDAIVRAPSAPRSAGKKRA